MEGGLRRVIYMVHSLTLRPSLTITDEFFMIDFLHCLQVCILTLTVGPLNTQYATSFLELTPETAVIERYNARWM